MRYHVYSESRHFTGAVAAGHSLHVYDDAAGTVTSSIYAAASGGSPLANPLTVPATGVVDFWATVPKPYVESGDGVKQPLPILVAVPADIGAPGLAAPNTFTEDQTVDGHRLIVGPGAMPPGGGHWGHIEIDHAAPETVSAIGFKNFGVEVAQVQTDPNAFVVCMKDGGGVNDRFAIGKAAPFRMQFGGVGTPSINTAGEPLFKFHAYGAAPAETCFTLMHPNGHTADIFNIRNATTDALSFRVKGTGAISIKSSAVTPDDAFYLEVGGYPQMKLTAAAGTNGLSTLWVHGPITAGGVVTGKGFKDSDTGYAGVSGNFTSSNGKTVYVASGIITAIV